MEPSSSRGRFWEKFKYVFVNREVIHKDTGKHGVVLFRPVHQGTLDEPDGNTRFEVIWKENGQYDYVNASSMNWKQLQPHLQPRFVRTPCSPPMVEHLILPLQEANWHATDAEWQQLYAAVQAAAQALKAQTREEIKALEVLTGERRAVEKAEAKQAAAAGAAAKSKAAAAAAKGSKADAAAAGPSSSKAAAAATAKRKASGGKQPAVHAKQPAAATKKTAAAASTKKSAAAAAATGKKKASATTETAPAAKKAKKEAAAAASDKDEEMGDTPSSSGGNGAGEDGDYVEVESEDQGDRSSSVETDDAEDEESAEDSDSQQSEDSDDEGASDDSEKPHATKKQPTRQTPKRGIQQQKAAPASAGRHGHAAAAAAESEEEEEAEQEEEEDKKHEQQQQQRGRGRPGSSKKGKQQPAAAAAATKQRTPKAAAGTKVYKGPTGRVYPPELAFVKGDRRVGTKAYDAAADGEFNVECIVDEVSVTLPTKHGKSIVRKVLPKWEGYELDVEGWEDAAGLKHLDLYKDWTKNNKPAYFAAVTLAAAANAFTAWYNQR